MERWERIGGMCELSGIKMTWGSGTGMPQATSISLDRIDRTKGYSQDNVRLICNCINNFRGTMTDIELFAILVTFHQHVTRHFPIHALLSEAA